MVTFGGHFDPDEIIDVIDESPNNNRNDMFPDPIPPPPPVNGVKAGKKGKAATDKAQKAKPAVKPIEPEYAGWTVTLFEKPTDQKASWIKTRRAKLPFASNELYEKGLRHHKESNVGAMGHYAKLNKSQQEIVDRLLTELNGSEKAPNAEWILFDVKKLHCEVRSTLRMLQVNHAIRIVFKRQDRESGAVKPKVPVAYEQGDDVIDLSKPPKTAKVIPEKKPKVVKPIKKPTQQPPQPQPWDDPMNAGPWQDALPPEDPLGPDAFARPDAFAQAPQQHYPQGPHPFSNPHQHPPPGAIPIPVPQQFQDPGYDVPPVAPEAPYGGGGHANPFAPHREAFPQPHVVPPNFDDRRPRTPSAHHHQLPSARRPSHSRHGSEDNYTHRRRSDENFRNLQEAVEEKIDGLAQMINTAASNNKVRDWPVSTPYPSNSSRSSPRDDGWSNSSSDKRYSTPGTSPDRNYRGRPSNSIHRERERRNSSGGARPYYDSGKRYYPDRDRIVRPHASNRDYDRRHGRDDYPSTPPREVRYIERERPRVMRRVTDYPEGYRHQADFGGRQGRGVDYTRVDRDDRQRDRYEERRGGRRQPAYNY